jgi:non-canonical (house-cleaning) NTP pyrophosphatase
MRVSTTWLRFFKMISSTLVQMTTVFNSFMIISVKKFNFHAGVGHHFELSKKVVERILKNFGQVVDKLIKGFACVLHFYFKL